MELRDLLQLWNGRKWYQEALPDAWDTLNLLILLNAFINPFLYGVFERTDCNSIVGTNFHI